MQYSVFENDFALTDYPKSAGIPSLIPARLSCEPIFLDF